MAKSLCSIRWKQGVPTLEDVCRSFGIDMAQVDRQYGVIEIDPDDQLYSILVEESVIDRIDPRWASAETDEGSLEGPFSNPPIEPFGPPEA